MSSSEETGLSIKEQLSRLHSLEEKRRFLIGLKKRRLARPGVPDRIGPYDRTGPIPLSFTQERLWFLDRLEENSAHYNISGAARIRGGLNRGALRRSLDTLVERHESLRTVFISKNGIPAQHPLEPSPFPLETADFSSLPETDAAVRAREWANHLVNRSFSLDTWPLMEAGLARLGPGDHLFLYSMHHMVSDGWSVSIFLKELGLLYSAFSQGVQPTLPLLTSQYPDYSLWQRRFEGSGGYDDQIDYWTRTLTGVPETLNFPTDYPIPRTRRQEGGGVDLPLTRDHARAVAALAKAQGATPFMVYLTLFYVLLHRYSGETDICIGTPVACRNLTETENIIGFFANTLALRVQGRGDLSFARLMAEVKKTTLEAYDHQDIPFARIVEILNPGRNLQLNPLFQAMIIHQQAEEYPLELETLRIRPFDVDFDYAIFDLNLVLTERGDGIEGRIECRTDIIAPRTAARMAGHYVHLLETLCKNPGATIGSVPLLGPAEYRQMAAWNKTGLDYDPNRFVHEIFEAQAAETPHSEAIVFGQEILTYAQLNERANQLARYLVQEGVGPETRVGLFSSRRPHLITAMLAVFKAGGAYVPIDPNYPVERVSTLLDQSGTAIVLTEGDRVQDLGPDRAETLFCLDRDWPKIEEYNRENLARILSPRNLAYVIYTSGSTGRPKGVAVEQANMRALVTGALKHFSPDDFRVTLAATSVCFDVSVFEIFSPLCCGGTLLLVDSILSLSEGEPARRPNMINAVPSAAKELIRTRRLPPGLRHLILAGEALSLSLVRETQAAPGAPRIHNIYGPTEATVYATGIELDPDCRQVTIGRPLPNTRVYILDQRGQPVPPGVWGELHIAGHHVVRGYLDFPELTARSFIPDPYVHGERMYRTGDRCRFLSDGRIEYGGRLDHQVKVRGFRIEPDEIENWLHKHPDVKDAAVNLSGLGDDKQLVAHVVPRPGRKPDTSNLRAFLLKGLPDYMVPTRYRFPDALPLTQSGKLDRKKLPCAEATFDRQGMADNHVPPRNEAERHLTSIWEDVLNLRPIGVHDNFFEIGGDSILSIQIVSQARNLGLPLKPRHMFTCQTIADLAQYLPSAMAETAAGGKGAERVPALNRETLNTLSKRGRIEAVYPLTPMQQGMLFHSLETPGSRIYSQHLRFTARDLDTAAFIKAWQILVREEPLLRTGIAYRELKEPIQVVYKEVSLPLTEQDLTGPFECLDVAGREKRLREIIRADREQALDMDAVPLFRLNLIRLNPDKHMVIWNYHHLLLDGWSLSLLMERLFDLYRAVHRKTSFPPRPRARAFGDFVRWIQAQDRGPGRDYWRSHLQGVNRPTVLGLERSIREGYLRREKSLMLGRALTQALQTLSRRYRVTLSTIFQAAFAILLNRYANEDRVVFGITLSGRSADLPHMDHMEQMIGLFINTLPLSLAIDPETPLDRFLKAVQETVVGHSAFEHSSLRDIRQWSGFPPDQQIFNVIMIFENYPVSKRLRRQTAGLVESSAMEEQSNYPMTLAVNPGDEAVVNFVYNGHVYDDRAVDGLMEHWRVLLREMTRKPEGRLEQLEILSPDEKEKILFQWNDGTRDFPDTPVFRLFEAQAEKRPDQTALVFENQRLCYGDLNRRSNRLAHLLRSHGVREECLVGICLNRGIDMIVAMLAVLKAGAAYLPLDPAYPPERLRYMLEDSGVETVISALDTMPPLNGLEIRIVHLTDDGLLDPYPDTDPALLTGPDNLAYVIYTSGSTGRPKGTGLAHRGLSNLVFCERDLFGIDEKTRTLQFFSFSFDGSVWDIFATLSFGGTLVLAPQDRLLPGPDLEAVIATHGVTWATLTPSALSHLRPERIGCLETVVIAGEAAGRELFEKWRQTCRVYNGYGPTEATVGVSCMDGRKMGERVSIGRPLFNLRLHILDRHWRPVPPGVPGELAIGGVGVARGYLNRPDMTADRFIPNPYGRGERLYRTGDLARYLPDGTVEFLGRMDNQIKVRGFRIEAGEVEAALEQVSGVETTLVLSVQEKGRNSLAAYLLSRRPEALTTVKLRAHLKESLPDHMIPSRFVIRKSFPLTPGGKIDRRRLRRLPIQEGTPDDPHAHTGDAFQTADEAALGQIWKQVLGVEPVGREDNFFEIGGDSISSIQIASRANTSGFSMTPRDIFLRPTIARLAELKAHVPEGKKETRPISYQAPLAPVQKWFFGLNLARPDHWNQSILIRIRPGLSRARLKAAFSRLYHRHDMLRARFLKDGGTWRQEIPGKIPDILIEENDSDGSDEATITRVCTRLQAGLDIGAGRLLGVALFRTGGGEDLLFIVIHHLVVDAVSWHILLNDLNQSLGRNVKETAPESTPFRQWAEHLETLRRDPEQVQQQNRWRKRVEADRIFLTPDYPELENLEGDKRTITIRLDTGATDDLVRRANAAYGTRVDELLLSVLVRVLAQAAGSGRWCIGVEGHGRKDPLDRLNPWFTVGWFTDLFPVPLTCRQGEGMRETILRVKETLRAFPTGGIGFDLLASSPAADIAFNYLGWVNAPKDGVILGFSEIPKGSDRADDNASPHELTVTALVMGNHLHISFEYSGGRFHPDTIKNLARLYEDAVNHLIRHCLEPGNRGHSPSDFPMADLTQSQVDALTVRFGPISDIFPLSPVQEGMLFHTVETGEPGIYFQHMRFRSEGLDLPAFKRAWESLVDREAVLRTAIVWQDVPAPLQVVAQRVRLPFHELNWQEKSQEDQVRSLGKLQETERRRGFDLSEAPIMRVYVIHLTHRTVQVILNLHHIILDGWSSAILLERLRSLYMGYATNQPALLPESKTGLRDYVAWIASRPPEPAERFWKNHLQGAVMPLKLGLETSDAGVPRMDEVSSQLDEKSVTMIREFSRSRRLTLHTWVHVAWAILFFRLTGQEKIVVGTTFSGRSAGIDDIETMIGMLLNTVPVCLTVGEGDRVETILSQARDLLLEVQAFEHTPLPQISRWLGMPRGDALFNAIVVLENYPVNHEPEHPSGLRIYDFTVEEETNYPLTLVITPEEGLDIRLRFDAARYSRQRAQSLIFRFARVLSDMAEDPHQPISRIRDGQESQLSGLSSLSGATEEEIL